MNEYKSLEKYLNKNKKSFSFKRFFSALFSKLLLLIIFILCIMIFLQIDKKNNGQLTTFLTEHNINFASINEKAKNYLGNIFPTLKKDITPVFDEKISYTSKSIYNDGTSLTVANNYLVPAIESGVVVFSGDKELYGKTIIIQTSDGLMIWYGNLLNVSVDIYDYVTKGDFLGEVKDTTLYMVFQKDNIFEDYNKYLS